MLALNLNFVVAGAAFCTCEVGAVAGEELECLDMPTLGRLVDGQVPAVVADVDVCVYPEQAAVASMARCVLRSMRTSAAGGVALVGQGGAWQA